MDRQILRVDKRALRVDLRVLRVGKRALRVLRVVKRVLWVDRRVLQIHALFYKQRFLSTQPQCCLTFSWIELQILLRCCLIHIIIIILRHLLYWLCLCPSLDLALFMSYLCDLFFFFVFIFIMMNCIISWIQTHLLFCLFLEYVLLFSDNNVDEECE